jgi:adenylate cyclase
MAYIYWDVTREKMKAMGIDQDVVDAEMVKHLKEAAKHPSTDCYALSAQFLVRQQRSDEAIEGLQKAMALNPSESWIYYDTAQATIFNGRPADALLFIESALRVDPERIAWVYYLQGLAYFSLERFEDAAAMLEKIDLGSNDFWAKYYSVQVLLVTYGHLGRAADIAKLKERMQPVLNEERAGAELTILRTQNFFAYKNPADFARLRGGLKKAGVPEATFGMDAKVKDRLTGQEITDLLVGHEAAGRNTEKPEDFHLAMENGAAEVSSGNWSDGGTVTIEGDSYCVYCCGEVATSCIGIPAARLKTETNSSRSRAKNGWNSR